MTQSRAEAGLGPAPRPNAVVAPVRATRPARPWYGPSGGWPAPPGAAANTGAANVGGTGDDGVVPVDSPASIPLIGREDELSRLAELCAITGDVRRSGVVVLSGDAGVGKTRLLHELSLLARDAGWRALAGHCLDLGDSALPYLPFTEAFGRLEGDEPALAESLTTAQPALARMLPGRFRADPEAVGRGSMPDRGALFEAVHAALDRLAQDAPLLLVVEDVHWADQSTRDLLSFLFSRPFAGPVALVVSYRSDDLHRRHPLRPSIAQWTRMPGVLRLPLGPLSDADVRSLVRALSPLPLREADLHTVVERAEGNAFFVEELVNASELGRRALPTDLADLLLVRLEGLDDAARQVVRVAAVAGRWVAHELLADASGMGGALLDEALRAAIDAHVMVPTGADGYAFRHALLAEAIYADLLPGERVRLHAAYVSALAAGQDGPAAEIARHARAAHDIPTAIRASICAGDDAMSVAGFDEAARHYEVALELLGDGDPVSIGQGLAATGAAPGAADGPDTESAVDEQPIDVVELTVKASTALAAAGRAYRALGIVEDQLARPYPLSPQDRARLLVALATAVRQTDSDVDALAATAEAVHLVPAEATELRADVLRAHALASMDRRRFDDAVRWAEEARELGRELGLPQIVADATTTLARADRRTGDEDARRALEQIIADVRETGDGATELRALINLAGLYYEGGDLAEALRIYQETAQRARDLRRPWAAYGIDARVLSGVVAYQMGEFPAALRTSDVSGQSPPGLAEALLSSVRLGVLAARGHRDGLALFDQIRPWWDRDGLIAVLSGAAGIDLQGDAGSIERAIRVHDDVVAVVSRLWQREDFQARIRLSALVLGQLANQALRLGSGDRADLVRTGDRFLGLAQDVAEPSKQGRKLGPESHAWMCRATAEHARLRWLAGIERPAEDDLVGVWRDAVAGFEQFPHVFEKARSQARLGAVLRAVGEVADARTVLDAARATAHHLAAEPLLEELRALGSTPARRPAGGPPAETLTKREQEVLELVAQGRSNREIGSQLFISAKTVSVHVSNILAKLEAGGRTEAVAIARRRGLLGD